MRSACFLVCYQTTYTIPITNLPQKSFYGFCKLKIVENHLTFKTMKTIMNIRYNSGYDSLKTVTIKRM